jgi:LmbE family N-acetylglucosaminyl deacetylase
MMRYLLSLLLLFPLWLGAQAPDRPSSADIYNEIKKLQFLGSALYIAAHPDDENTRLIAALANDVGAETAYLSLTRGDGGQNLIGPEIRELLGLIRTQELLAARRTDGGRQFFSRANDFGYSKNPDETFNIWNQEDVIADAVWVIRNWRPDIIVNRFDHRTPGRTHGHHTASAMVSVEVFDLAGDPTQFPDQLRYTSVWQPRRLFFNTSWWFYGSPEAFEKADKSNLVEVETGEYLPTYGESIAEIAARSRSQHKSQGFGSTGSRGSATEYLELIKGDLPQPSDDLFAGINTTWSRVEGGAPIGERLAAIERDFDWTDPAASVPALVEVYQMVEALPEGHWKNRKLPALKEVIAACLGLYLEAVSDDPTLVPGQEFGMRIEATNRSAIPVQLEQIGLTGSVAATEIPLEATPLTRLQSLELTDTVQVPANAAFSNPYWLNEPWELGMYQVTDQEQRGLPETADPIELLFRVALPAGTTGRTATLEFRRPLVYKRNDPVDGEVYRPVEIVPALSVAMEQSAYIFASDEPQTVHVKLVAEAANQRGTLELAVGEGWRVEPRRHDFVLAAAGQEADFNFQVIPPAQQSETQLAPIARVGNQRFRQRIQTIDYAHIPTQVVLLDAAVPAARLNLQKAGERIGYLMGAGDDIPAALRQIGYQVDLLADEDVRAEQLAQYDAVVIGIRAYNTLERMPVYQPELLKYVEAGGTMVVQYNTNRGLQLPMEEIGPYPLQISRDRVTVENAPVRILAPDHPALNVPNKITAADFEGWVQERGLYFPDEWDERYTPLLSSYDPGEPARNGGLLVARYGKGYYVYSGYSWFRELPAGVAGAYRLFVNLISLGNQDEVTTDRSSNR